jgi:hypothetical protein
VDALEHSDVVVFVRFHRCAGGVAACLHLLTQRAPMRVLRITLDHEPRRNREYVCLLAHELLHALEIARSPQVVDAPSFARFYLSSGHRSAAGFETDGARSISLVVGRELDRRKP